LGRRRLRGELCFVGERVDEVRLAVEGKPEHAA